MFLHYLTLHKNRNAILTSQDFDTWDHISQGIIDEAIDQCGKHSCMHVQRQRNVTSNTYCDLATQLALFRDTLDTQMVGCVAQLVERRSLTGELSLSYAQPAAMGDHLCG